MGDDPGPENDVAVRHASPEVEVPIRKPQVLGRGIFRKDGKRREVGGSEHLEIPDGKFHLPGRKFLIHGIGRAPVHDAVETHHRLFGQVGQLPLKFPVGMNHHLREAVVVPQINEQHPAVVAPAVDPAGKARLKADVFGALTRCRYGCDTDACTVVVSLER
jgi:hypothetical protein